MGYMKERFTNAQLIIEDMVAIEAIDLTNVPTTVEGLVEVLDDLASLWILTKSVRLEDMSTLLATWNTPYNTRWSDGDLKGLSSYLNRDITIID